MPLLPSVGTKLQANNPGQLRCRAAAHPDVPTPRFEVYKGVSHPVLGGLRVVLVSPLHPANVGAVLRAAANFEAGGVTLVAPRFDALGSGEVAKVACGSQLLDTMLVVPTLKDALADSHCSVGFTRRAGAGRMTHPSVSTMLRHVPLPVAAHPAAAAGITSGGGAAQLPATALVFGREESGLLDAELSLCSHACAIPTGRAQPSLNLSHAVAVVLAQLFEAGLERLGGAGALDTERVQWLRRRHLVGSGAPASRAEVESLLGRAARVMELAGLSAEESSGGGDKGSHGRRRRAAGHLRALLQRSQASTAEVRALHGLLREAEARMGGEQRAHTLL